MAAFSCARLPARQPLAPLEQLLEMRCVENTLGKKWCAGLRGEHEGTAPGPPGAVDEENAPGPPGAVDEGAAAVATEGADPRPRAVGDEWAAAGADEEETDVDEDPVEVRNRYLRGMNLFEMRTAWPVDWGRIDRLNALAPTWAQYWVDPQSLTRRYLNKKGKEVDFVQWCRDWALSCEFRFDEFALSDKL